MAGRGTYILLGGNPTSLTNDLIKELFEDKDRFNNNEFIKSLKIEDPNFLENLRLNYKDLLKTSLSELEEKTDPTTVLFLQIYNFILNEQKRVVIEEGKSILNLGLIVIIIPLEGQAYILKKKLKEIHLETSMKLILDIFFLEAG